MAVSSQTKETILVADDEASIRRILETRLSMIGYKVVTACDGKEALKLFKDYDPDLVVLDVMMPKLDGYGVCQELRKDSDVPIVMLTALGDVADRITGLELGADDYIGKPFEPKELLLRIKNIIKNNKTINLNSEHFIGKARVDLNKMTINLNEKDNKINSSEKKVLIEMLSNPGKTFSREEIGKISGISQERSIDVMVTRLRQKIEINPRNPKYLQTIRGSGYVLWIE